MTDVTTETRYEITNAGRRDAIKNIGKVGLGAAAIGITGVGSAMAQSSTNGVGTTAKPLKGKVAIVTGARNNMGRAFSQKLAEMGANVVVHYHRKATRDQAEETARLVREAGGQVALTSGDLGKLENVTRMYDLAESQFGGVDIVVNNAGAIVKKVMAEMSNEEFEMLNNVNNRALFYSLREASKRVRDNGRIINNGTSLLGGTAPGYTLYAGTKAPVEEYSRMLALELRDKKITVNTIAPGPVDTPFFHGQETEQSTNYLANRAAERRLGKIEDIVPVLELLASPEGQWINGQTLWVNGAFLTR